MLRWLIGLPLAAGVVIALFWVLQVLVFTDADAPQTAGERPDFQVTQDDPEPVDLERDRPEQLEPVDPPPLPRTTPPESGERPEGDSIPVAPPPSPPDVQPQEIGNTAFDTSPTPLVRVPPTYPENLQARGTEGRCLVTFDITPEGDTDNVSADCDVSGFERAAERAVREWKYRPEFRDGVAVGRSRLSTEVVFELAE